MTEAKQTLSTKCYELLTQAILSGEILPGERLLSENLKQRFGVGMSPIREALSKLAATHLVTFEEHKGFSVAKQSASQVRDEITTFAEIESLCLKQSIVHGDDRWEGEIIAALHSLSKVETGKKVEFAVWSPVNIRFHNALVLACPLKSLCEIRNHLYQKHQWYILLSYKFGDSAVVQANHMEHKQMAKAAIARKTQEAVDALTHHITSGVDDLIEKLISKGLIDES